MTATPPPTLIMGDPARRSLSHQWRLSDLARAAIADQRTPLVLHPHFMPWLYTRGQLAPYADQVLRGLVAPVARDTRAQLWLLLDHGSRNSLPAWAYGVRRQWLDIRRVRVEAAGVHAHHWDVWRQRVAGVGVGARHGADQGVPHGAL